jgi:hypothetical protein
LTLASAQEQLIMVLQSFHPPFCCSDNLTAVAPEESLDRIAVSAPLTQNLSISLFWFMHLPYTLPIRVFLYFWDMAAIIPRNVDLNQPDWGIVFEAVPFEETCREEQRPKLLILCYSTTLSCCQ